jgi:nucleotide-binding universal stress UspA family protein
MGTKRRYRIVVALDGSQYAEIVLEHALDQAARHDSPDLHLVAIVDSAGDVDFTKRWLARIALEGLDAFSGHEGTWRTRLHVRVGRAEEEIPNLAAEVDADMLVIGNYGVHPRRHPIAERVLARATCPTLVVGLAGHVVEAEPQCPDCVDVRESSDGEVWFCAAHTSDVELRLSTMLPAGLPLTRGGTLW